MSEKMYSRANLGKFLTNNKAIQFLEIFSLFIVAYVIIKTGLLFTGENPLLKQGVVCGSLILRCCWSFGWDFGFEARIGHIWD